MKPKMKEKILLLRIKTKKDSSAFGELYDLYIEKIYRFVFFKINSKEETEDITSEVFLKTWNYLIENSEKEIESFNGLIYRVARNAVIDHYRKRANQQVCSLDKVVIPIEENNFEKIQMEQEVEYLIRKIKRMKQDYQEILMFKYVEDLSTAEIARILNKSKTNIRVTLHRATKKLKELLDEE